MAKNVRHNAFENLRFPGCGPHWLGEVHKHNVDFACGQVWICGIDESRDPGQLHEHKITHILDFSNKGMKDTEKGIHDKLNIDACYVLGVDDNLGLDGDMAKVRLVALYI
jgi:hypothetical protein